MITEACKMHIHIQIVDYSIRCKSRVQNTTNNETMHTTKFMCTFPVYSWRFIWDISKRKQKSVEKVISS